MNQTYIYANELTPGHANLNEGNGVKMSKKCNNLLHNLQHFLNYFCDVSFYVSFC